MIFRVYIPDWMAVAQACSSQHTSNPKLAENEQTPLSKEPGKEAGVVTKP